MFPSGGATRQPAPLGRGPVGYRLRIPEMMHARAASSGGAGASPGRTSRPSSRSTSIRRPATPWRQMYYRYGGSFFGTMTETNRYVKAYREGKVPFVVNQAIWLEGETKFADIILPGLHQLRALGYRRVGQRRRLRARHVRCMLQPPGHRRSRRSASSRWASPSPTTRSSRELADRLGVYGALHHGRQDRTRLGQADTSTPPTWPR